MIAWKKTVRKVHAGEWCEYQLHVAGIYYARIIRCKPFPRPDILDERHDWNWKCTVSAPCHVKQWYDEAESPKTAMATAEKEIRDLIKQLQPDELDFCREDKDVTNDCNVNGN